MNASRVNQRKSQYKGQPSVFGIIGACLVGAIMAVVIFHAL